MPESDTDKPNTNEVTAGISFTSRGDVLGIHSALEAVEEVFRYETGWWKVESKEICRVSSANRYQYG
jgi:hypothetical protein